MEKILIFLFLLNSPTITIHAQESTLLGEREIIVYKAVAKTTEGTIKGILQRATADQVLIVSDAGSKAIPVTAIKSFKIKFDKKKKVQIFQSIAQASLDVIADPEYTRSTDGFGTDINGNPLSLDEKEASLGERVVLGGAMMSVALLGNEIAKLVPAGSIETFKIAYSRAKYDLAFDNLVMYTVDMQSSADYEFILKKKLKEAMNLSKLKP